VINPKTILGEWVTALQSCPDLVTAIGGDGDTSAHSWKGWPQTIICGWPFYRCQPGSILIAWNGTTRRGVSLAGRSTSPIASHLPAGAGTGIDCYVCRSVLAGW